MKINSGLYRGRKLILEGKGQIRPSLARVRKMVFDILYHLVDCNNKDHNFLDIFAGTGSYGFEALSIFGGTATFLEGEKSFCQSIRKFAETVNIKEKIKVICGNALVSLNKMSAKDENKEGNITYSVVFIDPPYDKTFLITKTLKKLLANGQVNSKSIIVIETSTHNNMNFIPEGFNVLKNKKTSSTVILILEPMEEFIGSNLEE